MFHNPLGRLAKLSIEKFGPEIFQADVRVYSVEISAIDGRGKLSGLVELNTRLALALAKTAATSGLDSLVVGAKSVLKSLFGK